MEDIRQYMRSVGQQARKASRIMAQADTATKDRALTEIAAALQNQSAQLIAENAKDVAAAQANGLDSASVDRLTLTEKTIRGMAEGLRQIAQLADPIGEISGMSYRPSGIQVGRMRVPLGVIRSEEHTSELQSPKDLVCRLLLEKKKNIFLYLFFIFFIFMCFFFFLICSCLNFIII